MYVFSGLKSLWNCLKWSGRRTDRFTDGCALGKCYKHRDYKTRTVEV